MPWDIVFYKAADESVPTDDFLDACPVKVRAQLLAVLDAVAEAPPPRFSGGGRWEAMHGDMGGYYEVRSQGPKREQFRLFCILENAGAEELQRRVENVNSIWPRRDHLNWPHPAELRSRIESCGAAAGA